MDDRQKAVIVAVLAAVTGIGGVLAFEAVTGSQPGIQARRKQRPRRPARRHRIAAGSEPIAERPAGTLPDAAEAEAVADRRSAVEGDVVETTSGGQGIVRRVRGRDRCEEPIPRGHRVWPALLGHQRRRQVDDHLAGRREGAGTIDRHRWQPGVRRVLAPPPV